MTILPRPSKSSMPGECQAELIDNVVGCAKEVHCFEETLMYYSNVSRGVKGGVHLLYGRVHLGDNASSICKKPSFQWK